MAAAVSGSGKNNARLMIVTELFGGMGNQMFQYAIARNLSLKQGTEVVMDIKFLQDRTPRPNLVFRNYDLGIFNVQEIFAPEEISRTYGQTKSVWQKIKQRVLRPSQLNFIPEKSFAFDPAVLQAPDNSYLAGYWQCEKYFKENEAVIRNDFTLKIAVAENVKDMARKMAGEIPVCLHVRRTDFVNNAAHGTMDNDYYRACEDIILQQEPRIVIYIFSDDIEWCKQNLRLKSSTVFVENDLAGEKASGHFSLMCSCRHFIIPNSSFSWWAAWLGQHPDKIVVAPKKWFLTGNLDTSDLLPGKWIKI